MRRVAVVTAIALLAGCTTTFVEEPTQTMPEPASPGTAAERVTTTTIAPTPTVTTPPSTSIGPSVAQDLFTTIVRPDDLATTSVAATPAAMVAVDTASGEVAWEVPIVWGTWYWTQLADDQVVLSSTAFDGVSRIAAIGLDGEPRWQTTTPLQTHGPFFIDDNRLIGTGSRPSGEWERYFVYALNLENGAMEWSVEIGWPPQYGENGPVVGDAQHVFAAGSMGDVVAIDTETGTLIWETELDSEVIDAPHLAGGLLLVGAWHTVSALDIATGGTVWSTQPDGRLIASPEGVSGGNAVAWNGNRETGFDISGIDLGDGSIVWTDSCFRQFEVFDTIVVGFAPNPESDSPRSVRVWDGATGSLLAEEDLGADIDPFSISASESTVFIGTSTGTLAALDLDRLRISSITPLQGAINRIATQDGVAYASASDRQSEMRGAIHAVSESNGALLWSRELEFDALTQPIIAGDLAIVVSAENNWGTF